MERRMRPVYTKQNSSSGTPVAPASPFSPSGGHFRSGSVGTPNMRKANTKAAAQRLAQVMSSQTADDEEDEDDDLSLDYNPSSMGSIGLAGGRRMRPQSPMRPVVRREPVKTHHTVDDEDERDDSSQDHSTLTVGRAAGRPMQQPRSPMIRPVAAAAQRREPPKIHQTVDDEDDKDETLQDYNSKSSIGRSAGKTMQPRSPMIRPVAAAAAQRREPAKIHQPVDDEDDKDETSQDYSMLSIGRSAGKTMQPRSPMIRPVTAASQRREQAKIYQPVDDDDDEEDETSHDYSMLSIGRTAGKQMQSRSPMTVRTRHEHLSTTQSNLGGRGSSANAMELPSSQLSSAPATQQHLSSQEQPLSARSSLAGRSSASSVEQPLSVRHSVAGRLSTSTTEQPTFAPAVRPAVKTVPIPASVPISLRPVSPAVTPTPVILLENRVKKLSLDMGSIKLRDTGSQNSHSALQDEVDMLQEENEELQDKLRLAAEKFDEAEARAQQLEKQIANFGEGVSLEARLLNRKEAALQQREAAVKEAEQISKPEEIAALRTEAETAKDEAISALELLQESEAKHKSLQNMTQRMILSQEEMEEVVLKRCWLARYWSFCVQYGILADIAGSRYEYWSSFAPLPVEVVLGAGQRAKDESLTKDNDIEARDKLLRESSELTGDGNIESMLLVERGLRELASLKIEAAVALAMARQRCSQWMKSDEVKLPGEGQTEAFELSKEEADDVRFKQAWLMYFWRRAKDHQIEPDIAEERLQFWINHSGKCSFSHDAVDVERGLMEVRKLGLENQLWQNCRKGLDNDFSYRMRLQNLF